MGNKVINFEKYNKDYENNQIGQQLNYIIDFISQSKYTAAMNLLVNKETKQPNSSYIKMLKPYINIEALKEERKIIEAQLEKTYEYQATENIVKKNAEDLNNLINNLDK